MRCIPYCLGHVLDRRGELGRCTGTAVDGPEVPSLSTFACMGGGKKLTFFENLKIDTFCPIVLGDARNGLKMITDGIGTHRKLFLEYMPPG